MKMSGGFYTLLSITTFALTLLLIVLYFNGIDVVDDKFFLFLVIVGVLVTIYSIPKIETPKIRKTLFGIVYAILILLLIALAVGSFLMHNI